MKETTFFEDRHYTELIVHVKPSSDMTYFLVALDKKKTPNKLNKHAKNCNFCYHLH